MATPIPLNKSNLIVALFKLKYIIGVEKIHERKELLRLI